MKAHTMVKSAMWGLQSDVLKATLATDAVIGAMVSDFNLSYKLELRIGIQRNELDSRKRYSDFQFFRAGKCSYTWQWICAIAPCDG